MATDFEQQEDPEYLQELPSRRQLEEEVRTLQEELHSFRSGSSASYSPSGEPRVSFAVERPPREARDTTMAAAAELLNHMRKNSSDVPATKGPARSRGRLTDYHERVTAERAPLSPPATQGYLNTFMEAMRDERRENSRQMTALIQALAGNRPEPTNRLNKAVPQVQAMREHEDLSEYFQLFEHTQGARNNPREAWASTFLPLLNPVCKSLALSLPATTQLDYQALKTELLALAKAQTEQSAKLFWERKKPIGSTWREEVAELTKLLRRCAPGPSAEEVRGQILVEKLAQMLPKHIQAFVRERKPMTPTEMADLISTYFHAHNMVETEWELRDKELATKKYDYKHGYSQQTNRSNNQTYYSNSQTNHSSNQTNHGNNQTNHSSNQTTKQLTNPQQTAPTRQIQTPISQNTQRSSSQHSTQSFRGRGYVHRDMSKVQCYNCKEYGHYAYQCVKVNVVVLPQVLGKRQKPPVFKQGKIGEQETTWCMDSGADMCFIAEDLLPAQYVPSKSTRSHARGRKDVPYCPVPGSSRWQED